MSSVSEIGVGYSEYLKLSDEVQRLRDKLAAMTRARDAWKWYAQGSFMRMSITIAVDFAATLKANVTARQDLTRRQQREELQLLDN